MERGALKLIHYHVENRYPVGIGCMVLGTQAWCSVTIQRGGMRRQMGGRFKREGTYVYLWLIRAAVWQKPTRY